MNHIVTFLIVFHITNIGGEKFLASLFTILPYLTNGHIVRIDLIADATREIIFIQTVLILNLGTEMSVVKAHHITVRSNHICVLLILPVKLPISHRSEEILLVLLRPSCRIANNPIQLTAVIINIHHRVNMAPGECQRIGILVIPHRIVVEPVMGRPASRFAASRIQKLLIIPGL